MWKNCSLTPRKIEPLPKTYILCTKSEFHHVTRVAKQKIAAEKKGWTYIELPSSHVPMADMPDEFYQLMLNIRIAIAILYHLHHQSQFVKFIFLTLAGLYFLFEESRWTPNTHFLVTIQKVA